MIGNRCTYLPDVVTFLTRHFGLSVSLEDAEGKELGIRARDISAAQLEKVLRLYDAPIKTYLDRQRDRGLEICIGGPFNGERHHGDMCGAMVVRRVARAKWAVYRVGDDHLRAWFVGFASSEKKARNLPSTGAKKR